MIRPIQSFRTGNRIILDSQHPIPQAKPTQFCAACHVNALLGLAGLAHAQTDCTELLKDKVHLINGDKVSGGIKELVRRTLQAGSAGRQFVRTSTMRYEVNTGLVASRDNGTDGTKRESLEGLNRSSFDVFKLDSPIPRLTANIDVFPRNAESGRIRVNSDVTMRNELILIFLRDLSIHSGYNNQSAEGGRWDDYGTVSSTGATF